MVGKIFHRESKLEIGLQVQELHYELYTHMKFLRENECQENEIKFDENT